MKRKMMSKQTNKSNGNMMNTHFSTWYNFGFVVLIVDINIYYLDIEISGYQLQPKIYQTLVNWTRKKIK